MIVIAFIALSFFSSIFAADNKSQEQTCRQVYENVSKGFLPFKENFPEEIKLAKYLETMVHPKITPLYNKFTAANTTKDFSYEDFINILRIGFKEQIFCNPWPVKIPQIIENLQNGYFTNSLLREINEYLGDESGQKNPLFINSQEELINVKKALEKLPSPFPKEVAFPSEQQGLTHNFYYFLRKKDGKIFVKPNPNHGNFANLLKFGVMEYYQKGQKIGNRTEWNLLNNDGGVALDAHNKIIEMKVASEVIIAIDKFSQVYIYKPTEYKTPTKWESAKGCPIITQELSLPKSRKAWDFSCSLTVKPETRRSIEFMHPKDIVFYYEDMEGKKIAFGFTATIYVLDESGRKIYYWDTGLPASFSRAFTTPHRGNFIAENISAAGSTIMVIGKNSRGEKEIYTRMYDYEINGACPGEQHTYLPTNKPDPDKVCELLQAKRRLPLPGWRKMPNIPLKNGDEIFNDIAILVTGQGNNARLLKVLGTRNGVYGFYQKQINDDSWQFLLADAGKTLQLNQKDSQKKSLSLTPDSFAMDYYGFVRSFKSGNKDLTNNFIQSRLKNFHYFLGNDEPASLEVYDKNGAAISLNLHISDAWNLTAQKKNRPELIGDKGGEPKVLLGTLIIPENYLHSSNESVKNLVQHFVPFHKKMNAFNIMASDTHVVMGSVTNFIDMDNSYKTIKLPDAFLSFSRIDEKPGFYQTLINKSEYLIKDRQNYWEVLKLIKKNKLLLAELEQEEQELAKENFANGLLSLGLNTGFSSMERVLALSGQTVISSIRKFLKETVSQHQHMNFYQAFRAQNTKKAIFSAKREVFNRIKEYEQLVKISKVYKNI